MTDADDQLTCEQALELLSEHPDYRVLERLQPGRVYRENEPADVRTGVYLDLETTGLDCDRDEIIEIGLVPFTFSSDGQLYRTLEPLNMLQEPTSGEIPPEITALTGIALEDVQGRSIDWGAVRNCIAEAAIIVAHNAGFDRPFAENAEPLFAAKAWACSCNGIDWKLEGFESSKLEYLAYKAGVFYEGHRATIDCYAGLEILSRDLPVAGVSALAFMLEKARKATIRIWANGAPFELKDELKARGYFWGDGSDGRPRAWYRDVSEDDHEAEILWLQQEIYQNVLMEPLERRITTFERYSKRV